MGLESAGRQRTTLNALLTITERTLVQVRALRVSDPGEAAKCDTIAVRLQLVADAMGATSATNDFEFDDDGDAFVGAVGAPPALTRAQVDGFRVVDLKKELAARGLKTSGLKAVLKARLLEALGLPAS